MSKKVYPRILIALLVLSGAFSVLPQSVALADQGYGYNRGTYCSPGNDPCMTVYLSQDHQTVTLTWNSQKHNKYQVRSDPPLARDGNPQLEFGGDVNTAQEPLLEQNVVYMISMQSCDSPVIGSSTCYGWTDPVAKLWTGPHELYGAILDKYQELGLQNGDGIPGHPILGYPNGDEDWAGSHTGRFVFFQGGDIFWSVQTGAHEVHGSILQEWDRKGRENGQLGYPTTDEEDLASNGQVIGRTSLFECGEIDFLSADHSIQTYYIKGCVTQNGYHNPS